MDHGLGRVRTLSTTGPLRERLGLVLAAGLALLLGPVAWSHALWAQEEEVERSWSVDGELGANVFFGASEQTTVLFRSGFEHQDERWEVSLLGTFTYGEAQNQAGERFVSNRSWSGLAGLDYEAGRWSPFFFGSAEGSFERAIDLRLSGGAGARYTFADDEEKRLDFSLATTAEYTRPRAVEGEMRPETWLARLSARGRARRAFWDERGEFNMVLFYRPALGDSRDYTIELDTSVSFALNHAFTLKLSLVDRYDNLAVSRGARANNDGRVYFSVLASH
jgi:hypothetical protein